MKVVDNGQGQLFMGPDPDKAGEFFRKKNRKQINKIMTLREAVAKFVHGGDYLGIVGFGANRTPVAACNVEETRTPAAEELRILREEVDPYKYVIGR